MLSSKTLRDPRLLSDGRPARATGTGEHVGSRLNGGLAPEPDDIIDDEFVVDGRTWTGTSTAAASAYQDAQPSDAHPVV